MQTPRNIPHRELIIVLLLTIVGLVLYAMADRPVSFLGIEIKQAPVKNFFEPYPPDPITNQAVDSIPVISVAQNQVKQNAIIKEELYQPQPDTSSQSILLTGDSMAEGLMFALKKYAHHNGHTLKTIIWYGSSTETWAATDTLQKLIAKYHPTFVFLTLGSNELFIRNIQEREPFIQDIISQAGKTKFIWIGPPNWKKDTGIGELLLKNVGEDRYFVSKDLIFERSTDGRHPTRDASVLWADTISTWVMQSSRYPIQLEKPVTKDAAIR